jgi:hypothetical protein
MAGTCICRFDLKGRGGPRRIATMGCPLHDPHGCDDGGEPEAIREIEHFPFTDHRSVAEVDAGVPAGAKPFRITAIPRPLSGQVFVAFDAMKASYTAMIPIAVAREIAEALDGALAILDGQHPAQTGVAVEGLGR